MIQKNNQSKKDILLKESEKLNHFNEEYFTQLRSTSTVKNELDRKVIDELNTGNYSIKVEYAALLMAEEIYPEDDLKGIWKYYQCNKIDHAPDVDNQSTPEKKARIWLYLLYRFIGWGSPTGLDVLNEKDRLKVEATENEELKPESVVKLINTINQKHNTKFPIPERVGIVETKSITAKSKDKKREDPLYREVENLKKRIKYNKNIGEELRKILNYHLSEAYNNDTIKLIEGSPKTFQIDLPDNILGDIIELETEKAVEFEQNYFDQLKKASDSGLLFKQSDSKNKETLIIRI